MEDKLLIVTVMPEPEVKLISLGVKRVFMSGEMFEDIGAGDTNGFYDFLRLPRGDIVGIRFFPFVEFSDICDSSLPGTGLKIVGISPTAAIELFWGRSRDYEDALSSDQFFDSNYIFKSSSCKYAVTFGFGHLPANETEILLSAFGDDTGELS